MVGPDLVKFSYFLQDDNGNEVLKQTGIVRTNCIDCLDRTNVVQVYYLYKAIELSYNSYIIECIRTTSFVSSIKSPGNFGFQRKIRATPKC